MMPEYSNPGDSFDYSYVYNHFVIVFSIPPSNVMDKSVIFAVETWIQLPAYQLT